ncbi:MAG: preprotein translocase subunit SecG [Acidobacteriota bacterium]
MNAFIIIVHVVVCIILILAVLLQSGKAADLAGAFGGTGSQTEFGTRGSATVLSKVTTAAAIVFMLTSLGLYIMSAKGTSSVVSSGPVPAAAAKTEPKTQAPAAQQPAPQAEQQKQAPTGTEQKK